MAETTQNESNILCGVCGVNTRVSAYGNQFGSLQAAWGYGSLHDGERYRVDLCEACFFQTLAYLRQERRIQGLFDEDQPVDDHTFGRIARNDFFGES